MDNYAASVSIRYAVARTRRDDLRFGRGRPYHRTHRSVTKHSPVLREGWWGLREGWRETVRAGIYSRRHHLPKEAQYDA